MCSLSSYYSFLPQINSLPWAEPWISIVYGLLSLMQKYIFYPQPSDEEVSLLLGCGRGGSAIADFEIRFFIYCLSFLVNGVDKSWVLSDDSRGHWIGSNISTDKKEALADRLASSDVVVLWVSGGGFRFDLSGLYIPTFIHWLKKLATKDIKCTMLLVPNRHYPKHVFPAAMEDLNAIHQWLVEDMGISRNKLIWGADDTGAAIALDTLYYKIESANQPGGLLLSSPYLGLDAGGKSWQDNAGLDIITIGAINRIEGLYGFQNDDNDDDSTLIPTTTAKGESPLGYLGKSTNLSKCFQSKILLSVGGNEVLLDDAVWMATRIRESGASDINLLQCSGQIHLGTLLGPPLVKNRLEWDRHLDSWVDFVISVLKR